MTNEEKLTGLIDHLIEQGERFRTNYESGFGITLDLRIPRYHIAVMISTGKDDDIYFLETAEGVQLRKKYNLIFIRDTDSMDFVIEKFTNCKAKIEEIRRNRAEWIKRREEGLRHHEECEKRHQERLLKEAEEKRMREIKKRLRAERRISRQPEPVKPVVVMRSRKPRV